MLIFYYPHIHESLYTSSVTTGQHLLLLTTCTGCWSTFTWLPLLSITNTSTVHILTLFIELNVEVYLFKVQQCWWFYGYNTRAFWSEVIALNVLYINTSFSLIKPYWSVLYKLYKPCVQFICHQVKFFATGNFFGDILRVFASDLSTKNWIEFKR